MPVYSMTGYASAQHSTASSTSSSASESDAKAPVGRLGLEIRSVNSRFLDLSFKLPEELRSYEPALRDLLIGHLKRGKVEVRASLESANPTAVPDPSTRLLQRLNSVQDAVKSWLPTAEPLSVAEVLRLCAAEQSLPLDWSSAIMSAADQSLKELLKARHREGARLATMLQERIEQLRALTLQAGPLVPKLVEQQRLRFMERWKEALALADNVTVAPEAARERALTEATAFAIRIDVAEEITRLNSHLDELDRLIKKGGEIGKRLDFLIQELHREANTLGSKSAALELTHISVDMKVLIEQMREQVQNIE
jgi:uncharacterized protein (TIGR00255 family)